MVLTVFTQLQRNCVLVVACWLGFIASANLLAAPNFLVLGVIASTKNKAGVALLKNTESNNTFAAKEGSQFDQVAIKKVHRKSVEVVYQQKVYILNVGDYSENAFNSSVASSYQSNMNVASAGSEIEKQGDTIRVTNRYKDFLIKENLSKVMMSAASEPYFKDGQLAGFTLWDIEQDSVFKQMGLENGDTVVAINQNPIRDAGSTIQLLKALKEEKSASLSFMRNGKEQTIKVQID